MIKNPAYTHTLICDYAYNVQVEFCREKYLAKRHPTNFVTFSLAHSTEKNEVKNMKTTEKQASTPAQAWTRRAEIKQTPKVDYYSELNTWLLHAITDAEKNKNPTKKPQLLTLQKDL
jgi:hypothetical protein